MPFQSHAYKGKWNYCVKQIKLRAKHMDDLQHVLFSEEEQEYDIMDDPEEFGEAIVETDDENSNRVDAES